jgi:DNA polymerase III delta subunit
MHNELSNVYIFTGTEIGIQQIYINQMAKVKSLPIVRIDSVVSAYRKCTTKSILGNMEAIYVIRGDNDITKHEEMYSLLSNDIGNNIIIMLYEKIDSRLKFGKFFKDRTVAFDKLTPAVLNSYIMKSSSLTEENASRLSNKVSGSYDLAMSEVDKIKSYSRASGKDDNKSFEVLLDERVIYQEENADVFEFTDAFCSRKPKLAIKVAKILADSGVSAINVLGTLYNSMKSVLLIQCCESSDIANTTGLDKGQIYFNRKYKGNYGTGELVDAVKLLERVIDGIKNGLIEEKYAVSYIIVKIM